MMQKTLGMRRIYLLLAFCLFIVLFYIGNPKIFWDGNIIIIVIIYIIFTVFLLLTLYLFLKQHKEKSNFIKIHFYSIFFICSIISTILLGNVYTIFIEKFIIPKPSHCEYTDTYGYLFEDEYIYDTCNVKIVDYDYNDLNELTLLILQYKTGADENDKGTLIREYKDEKLVKSTYKISSNIMDNIVFIDDEHNDVDIPMSNYKERTYDYIYNNNSFTILRTNYFIYNGMKVASEEYGYRYEFYNDRIDQYRLSGKHFLLTNNQLNDKSFQDSYISIKLNKYHTYEMYEGLERSDIIEEINQMHKLVDGSQNYFEETLRNSYLKVNDVDSNYYGYYKGQHYGKDFYFNRILYPLNAVGEGEQLYQFNNGYIKASSFKDHNRELQSEFKYVLEDDKLKYINEYIDDELVQRHVIKDLGVIKKVESYFIQNYGPGFKESDNWAFYNYGYHSIYSNTIEDFIDYSEYKFIIEPREIKVEEN